MAENDVPARGETEPGRVGEAPTFDYDPMAPEWLADPYPRYAEARRLGPIAQSAHAPVWVVTRAETIRRILRDPARFSSSMASAPSMARPAPEVQAILAEGWPQVDTLVTNDPPSHARFRGLVNKAFTPRRIAGKEPHVRALANALVDAFQAAGRCDLVWQFAYPLPMQVIAGILGVPREDMDQRLPNLRLDPLREVPRRIPHFFLRGYEHLWVEWDHA